MYLSFKAILFFIILFPKSKDTYFTPSAQNPAKQSCSTTVILLINPIFQAMKTLITTSLLLISTLSIAQNKTLANKSKAGCGPVAETNLKNKMENQTKKDEKNVLGTELQIAGTSPITGFYRDGFCSTGTADRGIHVVAAVVTDDFLQYSKAHGNDLITPYPAYGFSGLKAGDKWCLCAARWKEAYEAGVAPPVILEATHEKALEFATLEELKGKKK